MIRRKYNLNLCLAIALGAILLTLALGVLQKQFGIFTGADVLGIKIAKSVRFFQLTLGMVAVSWLGDEIGLMIAVCVIFWLGYTTEMITFLLLLLFGNVINTHLKEFFELSRPQSHEISRLVGAEGYGYPSGHSQTGMLYAWLIYAFVQRYWYVCLTAALLMAASRIYLGVHYVSDTVGGLICGLGLVVGATGIYGHVRELSQLRESIQHSLALKVGLSFLLSAAYLALAWGQPQAFRYAGLLAGFFMVYSMLGFRWRQRNPLFTIIVIVVGLVVLLSIRIGLALALPQNELSNYCRYFILGFFLAISPLFFVKIRLLKNVEEESRDNKQAQVAR
ncbi:MAG: phosphatase PAP2 family protein [Candidatus Hydrogenedentota bacterium]|nr:MAG: phosphatase PAP2 family protein [Candidatus Hydrogenedentota bacterium]